MKYLLFTALIFTGCSQDTTLSYVDTPSIQPVVEPTAIPGNTPSYCSRIDHNGCCSEYDYKAFTQPEKGEWHSHRADPQNWIEKLGSSASNYWQPIINSITKLSVGPWNVDANHNDPVFSHIAITYLSKYFEEHQRGKIEGQGILGSCVDLSNATVVVDIDRAYITPENGILQFWFQSQGLGSGRDIVNYKLNTKVNLHGKTTLNLSANPNLWTCMGSHKSGAYHCGDTAKPFEMYLRSVDLDLGLMYFLPTTTQWRGEGQDDQNQSLFDRVYSYFYAKDPQAPGWPDGYVQFKSIRICKGDCHDLGRD